MSKEMYPWMSVNVIFLKTRSDFGLFGSMLGGRFVSFYLGQQPGQDAHPAVLTTPIRLRLIIQWAVSFALFR